MSLTLESLSPLLSEQYKDLSWDNHISNKNFQLEIGGIPVIVSVAMKRILNPVPKTEIVFTGKAFRDIAAVEIKPLNNQIWEAVANHFKSQIRENPWKNGENEPIFDAVQINGQSIL